MRVCSWRVRIKCDRGQPCGRCVRLGTACQLRPKQQLGPRAQYHVPTCDACCRLKTWCDRQRYLRFEYQAPGCVGLSYRFVCSAGPAVDVNAWVSGAHWLQLGPPEEEPRAPGTGPQPQTVHRSPNQYHQHNHKRHHGTPCLLLQFPRLPSAYLCWTPRCVVVSFRTLHTSQS